MRVFITGATGLLGSRLGPELVAAGHEVVALSRRLRPDDRGVRFLLGDPCADGAWTDELVASDVVLHLAGAPIADRRWTAARKRELVRSRVESTRRIVSALEAAPRRPDAFVCASAVGYYGARGDECLTEASSPGHDFLARLCVAWEAEAVKAEALGVRVARVRFAPVLSLRSGALAAMLPIFKLGLGGSLGPGGRWFPWIGEDDAVGLTRLALEASISGPVNAVAPGAVRMRDFARTLGRVLRRPAVVPVPLFALRLALGEMGDAMSPGQRVSPDAAQTAGYEFAHPELEPALEALAISG
jgi:uncharacterized protein (TIGR01777 family)